MIFALAVVMAAIVVIIYRQKREWTDDLEAQRAAVAEDVNDTEQGRTARQAVNPVPYSLDGGAGPSSEMNSSPLHQIPDNTPIAPPQPMPMARPAPRTMPFGFTLDWSRVEST